MIGKIVAILSLVLTPGTAQAETVRQLVCPPGMTHCYYVEKPILSDEAVAEAHRSAREQTACIRARIEQRRSMNDCFGLPPR